MKSDWKQSKAHLLLLSRFINPNRFEDFARHDYWKSMWNNVLGESLTQAIKRFIDEGVLMTVTYLNDLLSYKCKVNELKGMLKHRSLPVSGLKEELIERLVRADEDGMRKVVAELSLLKCTQRGHEIAEQHLLDEKIKFDNTERQVMEYLTKRKYSEASLAFAAWESEQVFPLGFTTEIVTEKYNNPNRYNKVAEDRIKMLKTIFESRPKILVRLGLKNEKLENLRIAAAMMVLWGETKAKKWLPIDYEVGLLIDLDVAVRMVVFSGTHQSTLERYRNEGVKYVEVLATPDSCESCKKIAGKHYKLNDAPELPNEYCTHKMGCRCRYLPVIE